MKRSTTLALVTFALLSFALTGNAFAQQKEQASFKATPENSKITQGMNIDVGDAPNHIIRIFEVHRAYPSNAAVIAGLKLVEECGTAASLNLLLLVMGAATCTSST